MILLVRALLAASLALPSAALARSADDAGNRAAPLVALSPIAPEDAETRSAVHCNAARDFCLRAWRDGESGPWFLDVHQRVPAGADEAPLGRIALPPGQDSERERHAIWPHLIVEASGALLFGVERFRTAGFSGGGASETHLILFRRPPNEVAAAEVLTIQTGYTATIRACFSEADQRRLADACHQQLEYGAALTLATAAAAGRPRFELRAAARVFPRGSLAEGWESRRQRRADLIWASDPGCSYRRGFAFDAASGRYLPDRPLPDCSLYSLP